MCHDDSSRPPAPPVRGEVSERVGVTLVAADGSDFSAAYAAPAQPARAGVVVLPDVRGLHAYYVELAARFAEAGLAAVAVDYFGRTDGLIEGGVRSDGFDWQSRIPQTTPEGIDADTAAAVEYLRSRTRPDLPVIVVGFCFGGSQAWRLAASSLDLAGCVGFYGRPSMVGDAATHAVKPVVMIIAGADAGTPVEDQHQLAEVMRAAGADVVEAVYAGAPHSFFDRSFAEWEDACQDAWRQILSFVDRVSVD